MGRPFCNGVPLTTINQGQSNQHRTTRSPKRIQSSIRTQKLPSSCWPPACERGCGPALSFALMPDLHVTVQLFTATARMPIERRMRPAGCRDTLPRAGLVSCLACSIVCAVRRAAEMRDGSNPALGPRQLDTACCCRTLISRLLVSGCGPYLARHCRPAAASIEQRWRRSSHATTWTMWEAMAAAQLDDGRDR